MTKTETKVRSAAKLFGFHVVHTPEREYCVELCTPTKGRGLLFRSWSQALHRITTGVVQDYLLRK